MARTCAILQPHYLPWLGYFEMIDRVDVFVFLDDADFTRGEWKNRNRIRKGPEGGEPRWLTVPVARGSRMETPLSETAIHYRRDWPAEHLAALDASYARTPGLGEVRDLLAAALARRHAHLADLNIALVEALCAHLGIATPTVRASATGATGRKSERLIAICRALGADSYLATNASAAYLDEDAFAAAGIGLAYQDYRHPAYPQRHAGRELPFLSHLSVVDLLANHPPQAAAATIRSGGP